MPRVGISPCLGEIERWSSSGKIQPSLGRRTTCRGDGKLSWCPQCFCRRRQVFILFFLCVCIRTFRAERQPSVLAQSRRQRRAPCREQLTSASVRPSWRVGTKRTPGSKNHALGSIVSAIAAFSWSYSPVIWLLLQYSSTTSGHEVTRESKQISALLLCGPEPEPIVVGNPSSEHGCGCTRVAIPAKPLFFALARDENAIGSVARLLCDDNDSRRGSDAGANHSGRREAELEEPRLSQAGRPI